MYEDFVCIKCGTIEAKEDKVSKPEGDYCLDCSKD